MAQIKGLREMTNLTEISQELIAPRIGCTFCFGTLDPNDPNPTLREFITIQQRAYHKYCWSSAEETPNEDVHELAVLPPSLLITTPRIPVILHAGPSNTINDKPLGMSMGVAAVDGGRPQVFIMRNNSDEPQSLDRKSGLAWAYLDFDTDSEAGEQITLKPHQEIQVTLYPHVIRPNFSRREITIMGSKVIEVSNQAFSYLLSICLASFIVIAFIHLRVVETKWMTYLRQMYSENQNFYFPLRELISLITSGAFMASWFVFIQPGKIVWGIFSASCSISTHFTKLWPITDQVADKLSALIEKRFIPRFLSHPYMLIPFSIICGGAISLTALIPFLLITWLFSAIGIPWIVIVIYALLLLILLNISLQDYDIDLVQWFRLNIRKVIDEIRRRIQ